MKAIPSRTAHGHPPVTRAGHRTLVIAGSTTVPGDKGEGDTENDLIHPQFT
jgi:hypothetical protein